MKKKLSLILLLLLSVSLIFTACKKTGEKESSVALPIVSQQGEGGLLSNPVSSDTVGDRYPVDDQTAQVMSIYPIDRESPNYNEDMKAWIEELIGDQHTLDFIMSQNKTVAEWKALFQSSAHEHLGMTYGQVEALAEWLASRSN